VLEAWMTPSLFTPDLVAKGAIDQFTYMQAWGDNAKAQAALEQHWASWITAADFAQIKAAGLNTVRIPINHWMFGVAPNTQGASSEPYLTNGAELPYVDQALLWAQQYGLEVQLDMHTAPNSQNGFDNSGRQGPINFAAVTPDDNIARLEYALVQAVKRYVVDSKFGGVVTSVEALNEPAMWWTPTMTKDFMVNVHKRVYNSMQAAMSSVATKPKIVFHDGFIQPLTSNWDNVYTDLPAGTYAMDIHRYQAWAPQNTYSFDQHISYTCGMASELATSGAKRPVVMGEWSLAIGCTNCSYATMADNINSQNNATQNRFMRRFYEAQVAT
jgi:glucan 1,3-beta-glucosidase